MLESSPWLTDWPEIRLSQEVWRDGHPDPARRSRGLGGALEERAHAHGRSLNSEAVDCLTRQATTKPDVETWLRDVAALRAQIKGGPIPIDELVAATERDSH
jgi:hypothetical protein